MKIYFREATLADHSFHFHVRNDPLTREMSNDSEELDEQKSLEWFKSIVRWERRRLFLAYEEDPFDPFGVVRLDPLYISNLISEKHEPAKMVSWMVAPEKRGMGLGYEMLCNFVYIAGYNLWAQIKLNNTPSRKMAQLARFHEKKTPDDLKTGYSLWNRPGNAKHQLT